MTIQIDVAVIIGRFQPFHQAHAGLLKQALASAPKVVVVLGSAFHARSAKNPFTWQERQAMIAATLTPDDAARVSFVAVRDYYDDTRWAQYVCRKVEEIGGSKHIALVGYFKDASSYYLQHFPQWQFITAKSMMDVDATAIRQIFFEAENMDVSLSVLAEQVALPVRQFLKAWAKLPYYAPMQKEHQQISGYKDAWKHAPYPPVFVTVDAVVVAAGHVLLVQRGGFPGNGLWAIPGGFLDQRERLLHAAIRELREETQFGLFTSSLESALVDIKVFDHPDRSSRGRTITHAHFFDLKTEGLSDVKGSDDAMHAKWVPIGDLLAMEEEFFEDHFHILDYFLKVT
ncbi:MAG: bifunctional nicotinamide-nucleotide adenylyltransferase/Nudix hydroxylase [Burkholderiales bacterium]|nr:bifunctional nicotinamide-nucleotide adenylyltransferase/Nudix hydroxylase [Burkholderiales bacterium]